MNSVSVIIPTLNEAECIGGLLERLAKQSFTGHLEIIVVDGGSTDSTQEIVKTHEGVALYTSDPGVSIQRNLGASVASQELLCFIDADTLPSTTFLENVVRQYEQNKFAVACPWFVPDTLRPDIQLVYAMLNSLFFVSQLRFHAGAGVCIVTPRAIFQQLTGFDESLHLGEDVDYIRRAAAMDKHKHMLLPLVTSARRFEQLGVWRTAGFYARISPALMIGNKEALRKLSYPQVRTSSKRIKVKSS